MADKAVSELVSASSIGPSDLFVLEQNGVAKKLPGQVLLNWLTAAADGHGGISSIAKVQTNGLVDTYRITLADTTVFDFAVSNGRGIVSITKKDSSGLVDTYSITFNDGSATTFSVANGAKGDQGDNAYVWIKYASQEPTVSSNSFGDIPDQWMGVYSGPSATAPTDYRAYKWFQIKGRQGDIGEPATLVSSQVEYQLSTSGNVIPAGNWESVVPNVPQGMYLWSRITHTFNTGSPITFYSVSRAGMDGLGAVATVNNVQPDASGNVVLHPEDIGAVSLSGGTMMGYLDVLSPVQGSHAASKSYVDTKLINATLQASGWSTSAPYVQSVTVPGLTDSLKAKAYPNWPEDDAQETAMAAEAAKVSSCKRSGNTLTFKCREERPTSDIYVTVEVYV